jgi:hypothetical protein
MLLTTLVTISDKDWEGIESRIKRGGEEKKDKNQLTSQRKCRTKITSTRFSSLDFDGV